MTKKEADRGAGGALAEVRPYEEGDVLFVWVAAVGALKAGILAEVVAPVVPSVRVAAVLKVYELHGGHRANCTPRLHLLRSRASRSNRYALSFYRYHIPV